MAQDMLLMGKDYFFNIRTMRNSAIWKYSPNGALDCATHRQSQDPILVVQTQVSPLNDGLTARPAFTGVMSPALHNVARDSLIDGSWVP